MPLNTSYWIKRFFILACGLWLICRIQAQDKAALLEALKMETVDSNKLRILSDLHWATLTSPAESQTYAEQEIRLATEKNHPRWIAQGYNDLGIVQQRQNQFRRALESHKKALAIRRQLGRPDPIGSSLSKMGLCYSELDSLEPALKVQLEALVHFRKSGNERNQAYTLNNLAFIYHEKKDWNFVGRYAAEALLINRKLEDPYGIASSLNFLASIDENDNRLDSAFRKYEEGLRQVKKLNSPSDEAVYINNMAHLYSRMGKLEQARAMYRKAGEAAQEAGDLNSVILYKANLASAWLKVKNTTAAYPLLREALGLAEKEGLPLHLPQVCINLGDYFTLKGQADSANFYYNRFSNLTREAFSEKLANRFSELNTGYEIAIRDQQKTILEQEVALREAALHRSRIWIGVLLAGAVLLVWIFVLLRNRQKLLEARRLEEEKRKEQDLRARAILEAEERERTRIARDLHDGVGQQLAAIRLNMGSLVGIGDGEEAERKNRLDTLVDEASRGIRTLSHTLLAREMLRNGLQQALQNLAAGYQGTALRLHLDLVGLEEKMDPALELHLYRMAQELMQNVLRHSAASEAVLQVIRHEDHLLLQVEDNGKGFNPNDTTSGVGLENLRSRVDWAGGEVFVDSHPGRGTTVTIQIPLGERRG